MTKLTIPQWTRLISKAARDTKFRKDLTVAPKSAAATLGLQLNRDDITTVKGIVPDLKRFADRPGPKLAAKDAKSWAIGIMHITELCACEADDDGNDGEG